MKTYDIYKPTKIEFLDAIPEHWKEKRLRFLGYLYGGLTGKSANDFNQPDNEENRCFIPFTNIAGNLKINPDQLQNVIIKDGERQNEVRNGDLFFLMSSEDFDDVGKSAVLTEEIPETYLNSFCKGLRITSQEINSEYLNYHLHSKQLRHNLLTEANGFTRINLKVGKVQDLFVAYPKKSEQTAIASYLDRKTAQIDELIADKKRLLELYEEEKTALINQAVTKGLDPDVPMKDSGIEWLGEIPEHWEVKKVKHVLKSLNHIRVPLSADERGKMLEKKYDYYGASGVIDKVEDYLFNEPTLLIGEDGANLITRSTRLAFIAKGKYWVNNHAHILKPKEGILEYYAELMEICDYSIWISGSAQPKLTSENLMNIWIIVPPLEEQKSIVHHIETECKRIDTQIEHTKKLIELLKEYREALISEVVTGKIKVID
jgi:type I restriction enzyme S subunit